MITYGVAGRHVWRALAAVTFVALVLASAGCREADIEESLGRSSAREIESSYGVVEDPLLAGWTTDLGEQVVHVCGRPNIPYEFKVLDTDMVNAFAAPYGHVYFTRGILDFVDREDELAFVMSHEVGHVVAHHAMSGLKKQFWLSVLFSAWNTRKYATLKTGTGIFATFGLLRYSRENEYEADRFGIEYALAEGYDPVAGAEFFRRLEQQTGHTSGLDVYFMTHPPTNRRIDQVNNSKLLAASNAASMLAMGKGYAARGQYRRAAMRFQEAVAADRRSVDGHMGLAKALTALGKTDEATREFNQVLRLDANNDVAKTALARLGGGSPGAAVALARPEDVQAARTQADAGLQAAQAAQRAIREVTGQGTENLTASRDINHDSTAALLGLTDLAGEAEGVAADLVKHADLAVGAANESLYGLEDVDAGAQDSAARVVASIQRGREALGSPGGLDAWRVASLREAGELAQRASQSLGEVPAARPDALGAVRNAQRVANNVVAKVDDTFRRGGSDEVIDSVTGMTEQAQEAGDRAKEKVDRLKEATGRARTDALLAQIDVLGATAPPAMTEACDQMVAHYFSSEADAVRKMREDGRTYGQIALTLAAARSLGRDPARVVERTSGIQELTEAVERQGVDLSNADVLLKFLANTLEEETAAEA